ncbi:glycosyltransferase family 117 protein [Mucilaginibacter myungsuensis]|uniref:DUF2723 domain-containing protein n=1 Tax=Mucilaginibacter myungsuensis TaxID=649104 RepID=A0A929PYU9_9SPHI|nr:DUF2723 domain-containing protein [Mucilaginibacter myungsuensis]MBE9663830.1 DUF2723 domain-containing protein [Mucilaginibacter myungsuensis]MDN3598455.1 DUF2723 domain-containing protein [Mucilaginibacter myungsuensis]
MNYAKINNIFGWLAFLIAAVTYTLTLEPSASFWDCGEFIACIYRLQVAHQPGAPLFTIIGKAFSLLSMGDIHKVAYWSNMASAMASAATILFLFWSITALAKKILIKKEGDLNLTNTILIIGAGLVGALAYSWSDTFWFSAVESEVYAESSLCTAIVFWAILKWEAHADEPYADRWLIFIAYIMGLSIGIHLLNLLVIPAIAVLIYFRRSKETTAAGTIWSFVLGVIVLGIVLWGVIQFSVKGAAFLDLLFVNSLGFGFGSGAVLFYLLLIVALVLGVYYTIKPVTAYIIAAAGILVLLATLSAGASSAGNGILAFVVCAIALAVLEYVVKIRQKRYILNMALVSVMMILFGYSSFVMLVIRAKAGTNLNNSDPQDAFTLNSYLNRDQYGDTPLLYGPYFDAKPESSGEEGAAIYRRGKDKYEIAGHKQKTTYDHNTIFPRMHKEERARFYRQWMQLGPDERPTLATNLGFFLSWQINQMYTRYFLWNFVGRTNEMDGQNSSGSIDGNWANPLKGGKAYPYTVTDSKAFNKMYGLPLIIGLIGAVFHFMRRQKDAGIVGLLFFFTGLAIVLYLNQDPLQPRERDYAYAGSFYAFAIWIGLGVLAIAEFLSKKINPKMGAILATVVCLLAAPILMASQEWDDHDRSTKYTPRDMASNYLNSCAKDAILFTYGDNDTYPLWYAQEVENVRPDIRIVNLSLLGTDWYIRQMKQKMNESAPLPITMPNEKFQAGVRDVTYFADRNIAGSTELKDVFDFITSDDNAVKEQLFEGAPEMNYLPTKNLKMTLNADQLVKDGVIPAADKAKIPAIMEWKYRSNYVTKDNLAMMDILSHNNFKRPVYFTITVGSDNMMGLDNYMYNEGFTYHLLPIPIDTAVNRPLEATNTMAMYNNMMTKFKFGNFKHAKFLDHESLTMFYPIILKQFLLLADHLIKEGRTDLAQKALAKFDAEMPNLTPYPAVAYSKEFLAQTAYRAGADKLAAKWSKEVNDVVVNLLDYSVKATQASEQVDNENIEISIEVLGNQIRTAKAFHQDALADKYMAQYKNYATKLNINLQ